VENPDEYEMVIMGMMRLVFSIQRRPAEKMKEVNTDMA
jgi:hypothetical protein